VPATSGTSPGASAAPGPTVGRSPSTSTAFSAEPDVDSTGATTATTTPGTPTAVAYSWQRATSDALDLGGGASTTLSAVLAPPAAGGSWLIVGTRVALDGSTAATVWSSRDAEHWQSDSLPGVDGRALAATNWGARTVVVGSTGSGAGRQAAVWISPGAGLPFAAVAEPTAFAPTAAAAPGTTTAAIGGSSMDVVGAGTAGVFAVGSSSGRPAMWYSTDGTDWQRVPGAEQLIDGARDAQVTSILVAPSGVYVGGTVQAGTVVEGALWISNDGINWRKFISSDNPFAGPGDHVIDGLSTSGTSLVAVGAVRSGAAWTPAAWISPDGSTWTEADEALPASTGSSAGDGAGNVVRNVVATPSGLAAVGGSSTEAQLWTSPNGAEWTDIPFSASAANGGGWSADLVASNGSTAIVVDSETGEPHVLVHSPAGWDDLTARTSIFGRPRAVATPAALLRLRGRLLLVVDVDAPARALSGTGRSTVVVLESADGSTWRQMTGVGRLRGAKVDAVAVTAGRLVAVGEGVSPAGSSQHTTAAAWTSRHDRRWVRTEPLGSPRQAAPTDIIPAVASAVQTVGGRAVVAGWGTSVADQGAGPHPLTWSASASTWGQQLLEPKAALGRQYPLAACSNGQEIVVVGTASRTATPPPPPGSSPAPAGATTTTSSTTSTTAPASTTTTVPFTGNPSGTAGQGDDGSVAASWSTTDGTTWAAGRVSPITGVGADVKMLGCVATSTGFIAYGQIPSRSGQNVPAIWTSPDGSTWTLAQTPTLTSAEASPFTDLDVDGSTWNAVSGGAIPAAAESADPTVSVNDPVIPPADPATSTGPDGEAGVWQSIDGGAAWAQLATSGPAWAATQTLSTDELTTVGSDLIVVGQVDGRLAVWSGAPAGAASS
jgi:hypothetical protein